MTAYFNDNDPKSAAWLRELIKAGLIADGVVDERSILEVEADDLREFTQCHFFAGIGGWSYSLRLAGVPDDMEVWTGSPPCQPFSAAGLQKGKDDARHLAPKFASLVRAARPALLFGEQVASAAVFGPAPKGNRPGFEGTPPWAWLDDLSDRLEAAHYAVWANDVPAAGVGAPHIRQRTFFGALRLADAPSAGLPVGRAGQDWAPGSVEQPKRLRAAGSVEHATGDGRLERRAGADGRGAASGRGLGGLADTISERGRSGELGREDAGDAWVAGEAVRLADTDGRDASAEREQPGGQQRQQPQDGGTGGLADANDAERRAEAAGGHDGRGPDAGRPQGAGDAQGRGRDGGPGPTNGFWRDADWLYCRDGKWRPVETRPQSLADGLPEGMGRVLNPRAEETEGAIELYAEITEARPEEVLRDLCYALAAEAGRERETGGVAGLLPPSLLLAFVCQLAAQGWSLAQGLPLSRPQKPSRGMRMLWDHGAAASAPRQRGLVGQPAGEPANLVHLLSPLLARDAQAAWGDALAADAEIGFPLGTGSIARVARLRGYGNAISPEAAQAFIEASLEALNDVQRLRLMSDLAGDVFG